MKINDKGRGNKVDIDPSSVTASGVVNFNGDNNSIIIGKDSTVKNMTFTIHGNNHKIVIGNGVSLQGDGVVFEDSDGFLYIGNNTFIFQCFFIGIVEKGMRVSIGKDCLLSNNIRLRTSDSHSIVDVKTKERINYGKDIIIGDHVWICENVHILKGARIQNDSVIGACSVVTDNLFPPNSVIVGNPAKVVKTGINWQIPRIGRKDDIQPL